MLAGLAFCEMPSQYPQSAFQWFSGGQGGGSAAACHPNPPRPFARRFRRRGKAATSASHPPKKTERPFELLSGGNERDKLKGTKGAKLAVFR